jgi:CubicO group peptidase (beta-lactamase class C family)
MSHRIPLTLAVAITVATPVVVSAQSAAGWPTKGWKNATPESQGVDATALKALDAEIGSGAHGYIDGMLVIKNGFVVYEASYSHDYDALFEAPDGPRGPYNYYDPDWHPYYEKGPLHTMQSVSKSVTSALIGIAIGRGQIPGVDVKVLPYFSRFQTRKDPGWAAITLEDLLTMTSGIEWDESTVTYTDPRNSCARMEASDDWIQFVVGEPMAATPGERYVYNSGVTMLLAQILLEATGEHADVYAEKNLFGPLGIESYYWKKTPPGLLDCEGGLYLTPRDLAKIGYLYQHDGRWEGKRILPEGWVTASTKPAVTADDERGYKYGYQWWLLPNDGGKEPYVAAARGYGGQYLLVVPEHDLIAVFTGWNIYDKPPLNPKLALDRVLEAVR